MNLIASMKARSAAKKMSDGNHAEAKKLYEEAVAAGFNEPRYLLSYSVLLIREGEFQKARELLVQNQNNPLLTDDSRRQLYVNYAVCVYKLGDLQKGIELLERQHAVGKRGELTLFKSLHGLRLVRHEEKEQSGLHPKRRILFRKPKTLLCRSRPISIRKVQKE